MNASVYEINLENSSIAYGNSKPTLGAIWCPFTRSACFTIQVDEHIEQLDLWLFENAGDRTPSLSFEMHCVRLSEGRKTFKIVLGGEGVQPGLLYGLYPKGRSVSPDKFSWQIDIYALSITPASWLNAKLDSLSPSSSDFVVPKCVLIDRGISSLDPSDLYKYIDHDDRIIELYNEAKDGPLASVEREFGKFLFWELHVHDTRAFPLEKKDLAKFGSWRGFYRFLSTPPFIRYLKQYGVNTLLIMPVQASMDEWEYFPTTHNYWGYNPISFFALQTGLFLDDSPHGSIIEMMLTNLILRANGISTVVDSVFNHTCERGAIGPAIAYRTMHPHMYLRYPNGKLVDKTNSQHTVSFDDDLMLNVESHMLDFLQVDGFRFDVGPALAQTISEDGESCKFDAKLIANWSAFKRMDSVRVWEPAAYPYEYPHGQFPETDLEWVFADWARDFLTGKEHMAFDPLSTTARIAYRMSGNSDYFRHGLNRSVRFASSHDGYNSYDWAKIVLATKLANADGKRVPEHDWSQQQLLLLPYMQALNSSEDKQVERLDARLEELIRDTLNIRSLSLLDTLNDLIWSLNRALHTMVVLSPGALLISRGDIEGWTQGGLSNSHNRPMFVNHADTQVRRTFSNFLRELLLFRNSFDVFTTSEQLDSSRVDWYSRDGDYVESPTRLSNFADRKDLIWNSQHNFLGVLYKTKGGGSSNYLYVALCASFDEEFCFQLPHSLPDKETGSGFFWKRCVDSSIGEVATCVAGRKNVFKPFQKYLSNTPRVVAFRLYSSSYSVK